MTLRARLLITVGALLTVALVVTGALLVGVTRNNLVADVDADLISLRQADLARIIGQPGRDEPTGRRFAIVAIDPQGAVTESRASGLPYAPDPLPSVPKVGEPSLPVGVIVDRPSIDGTLSYRVRALRVLAPGFDGYTVAVAAPLYGVDRSVIALVRALLLVGAAVLLVMLIVGWFLIRRDLR